MAQAVIDKTRGPVIALLDANVLYPAALRDLLMHFAIVLAQLRHPTGAGPHRDCISHAGQR
jgi:hypothetical protein